MNWRLLFDPRGTNWWLLVSNIGWNVIWMFATLLVTFIALDPDENVAVAAQLGLMIGAFVGPFLGGWFVGRMAADGRGPTYGVIGSLGSVVLILCTLLTVGGILGLLVAVIALFGGFNGGLYSEIRRLRK